MAHFDATNVDEHLDVLRSTPLRLADLVETHERAVLQRRPFEGKWTPGEILGHLVDHEIVTASRIRSIRLSGVARLDSYPQEVWVTGQKHAAADPSTFARRFAQLRELNLEQYETLAEADWGRLVPRSDDEGDDSLLQLVRRHADHDLHQLEQLDRYVQAAVG